jgi:hypothetical protein
MMKMREETRVATMSGEARIFVANPYEFLVQRSDLDELEKAIFRFRDAYLMAELTDEQIDAVIDALRRRIAEIERVTFSMDRLCHGNGPGFV